jgi:hypothetical protein
MMRWMRADGLCLQRFIGIMLGLGSGREISKIGAHERLKRMLRAEFGHSGAFCQMSFPSLSPKPEEHPPLPSEKFLAPSILPVISEHSSLLPEKSSASNVL